MAGCLGWSHAVTYRNEVVSAKKAVWSQKAVVLNSIGFRNVGFCGTNRFRHVPVNYKRHGLVTMSSSMESSNKPGSSVGAVTVPKESGEEAVENEGHKALEPGKDGIELEGNGGDGGLGNGGQGGGGGGDGGGDEKGGDGEEDEFGPLLKFEEVMRETEARGMSLPLSMLEAAKSVGIRRVLLLRYLDLQVLCFVLLVTAFVSVLFHN